MLGPQKRWKLIMLQKSCHWILIEIGFDSMLVGATFRGVLNMGQEAWFSGHLGLPSRSNVRSFFQKVLLIYNQYCLICSLQLLWKVSRISPSEAWLLGRFRPPNSSKFGLRSFSQKFSLVSHQSCFTCSLELLSEACWTLASEGLFFGSFRAPLNM